MCLFSFLNTGQYWPGGATLFVSVRVGVLLRRSCHRTLLQCKAGNGKLLPIAYERYNGPVRVVQKHGHECIISGLATCNQVGKHGLYPGHYSGKFVAPRTHKTQKPSVGQGLWPLTYLNGMMKLDSSNGVWLENIGPNFWVSCQRTCSWNP